MQEYSGRTPEKPLSDLKVAFDFLLGKEGEEWLWEEGGVQIAELIFEVSRTEDARKAEELRSMIEWIGDGLPPSITNLLMNIDTKGKEAAEKDYLVNLESFIIENLTEETCGKSANGVRVATNIQAWGLLEAVQKAQKQAESHILAEEPVMSWLTLSHETNRFQKHMKEEVSKYLRRKEEVRQTRDLNTDEHNEHNEQSDDPEQNIHWALAYLLSREGKGGADEAAYIAATQLYQAACDPSAENQMEKLYRAVDHLDDRRVNNLLDAIDAIILRGDEAKEDFHRSLVALIQDFSGSDLSLNAAAARFAGQVRAWELAGTMRQAQAILSYLGSDAPINNREHFKREVNNFFVFMTMDHEANPTGQKRTRLPSHLKNDAHNPNEQMTANEDQAEKNTIRGIIDSLDIDWGDN